MNFYLDITPAIVNKTAIHNIIKDSIDSLPEAKDQLLLIGKPYSYSGTFGSGLPKVMRIALKFPNLFVWTRRFLIHFLPRDSRPVFFFDPLYLLFYRKLATAKVMVLDLTPITHPYWHNAKVAQLYAEAFRIVKAQSYDSYSISESTRSEMKSVLNIEEDKNHLLYLYSHKKFKPHGDPVFSKQILFVGSFEPRKNLVGLIQGFVKSGLGEKGYTLNIVGAATNHYETVKSELTKYKNIIFHGYLSDDELQNLYQTAQVFAYPSHWEGFGVPLLEAINVKIAAFASRTSACPEVGGPGMQYVDPKNELEIAQALEKICLMSKEDYLNYTEANWIHAQRFSFEKYIQILQNALRYTK